MKNDERLMQKYLEQNHIPDFFDTADLPFVLCQYKKGEVLNARRNTAAYLQFLVKGAVQIYSIQVDGSKSPVCLLDSFSLLGDIEFCGDIELPFFIEAASDIICVELSLNGMKDKLLNDNRFLRLLLKSVTRKLSLFARSEVQYSSVEEKLLAYLKYERPDHSLHGVEATAVQLRCSRRQLQRALQSLAETCIIEKIGKGRYRLNESGIHDDGINEVVLSTEWEKEIH